MTDKGRMQRVLNASPEMLRRIDGILMDRDKKSGSSDEGTRTLTFTEAAKRLCVSRTTIYSLVKAGRLETMKLGGCHRIRLQSLFYVAAGRR